MRVSSRRLTPSESQQIQQSGFPSTADVHVITELLRRRVEYEKCRGRPMLQTPACSRTDHQAPAHAPLACQEFRPLRHGPFDVAARAHTPQRRFQPRAQIRFAEHNELTDKNAFRLVSARRAPVRDPDCVRARAALSVWQHIHRCVRSRGLNLPPLGQCLMEDGKDLPDRECRIEPRRCDNARTTVTPRARRDSLDRSTRTRAAARRPCVDAAGGSGLWTGESGSGCLRQSERRRNNANSALRARLPRCTRRCHRKKSTAATKSIATGHQPPLTPPMNLSR